jgi:DNA (cytosine-5)-methyltransferase 1
VDPRRYPWTNVLWASPECTNHSQAKGRKRNVDAMPDLFGDTLPDEAAERSRATMWDVVRFAEHHRYDAIVGENVVYAALWVLWQAWRAGLDALGYCAHVVYLNRCTPRRPGSRRRSPATGCTSWRTCARPPAPI